MNEPKFQENQVVKIKSYEELKSDEYHLLYSDERLKEVAQAEVAIYKVINDLRAVTWYQVGQCGHNVIEIPETYIKGEVKFDKAPNAPDDSYQRNFYEFSNMVRAAVWNRQYRDRDLEILLKESLKELESKQEKQEEAEISKMKEDLEKFFSGMWKHHPASFLYNKDSKFKPRMLTYDSAAESSKDESVVTDRICVRGFLKVPKNYIESIPHSKTIIENIRKYSAKEEELPYTYQDVLRMIERQLEMFSTRWYRDKLQKEGLIPCFEEINHSFSKIQYNLKHYGGKRANIENNNFVNLAMFSIQTIIHLENIKKKEEEIQTKAFFDVTNQMFLSYRPQNDFYGMLNRAGLSSAIPYFEANIKNYRELIENKANVADMVRVLMEIASCCVLTILWIDQNTEK